MSLYDCLISFNVALMLFNVVQISFEYHVNVTFMYAYNALMSPNSDIILVASMTL